MRSIALSSVLGVLLTAPLSLAQTGPSSRLHWYLERELRTTGATDRLPIYIVLADRLSHGHWFPRVQGMPLERRRQVVVAELRDHATRTQRPILDALRVHSDAGRVTDISSNWLGNFVVCKATPAAVRDVARLAGVDEMRYDATWPRGEVEDGAPPRPTGSGTPSNGAINTEADAVWKLGFTGRGVVVMNADSGINIQHGDLAERLWTNPGEIPGNGIDDDGNGYIDDVHGWNFFDDSDDIDDSGGHGTHTAGTLVGDGSCSGTIAGQAPGGSVMTGALGPPTPQTGPFTPLGEVAQWEAVQYAIQMGAHIQTSSYSYKNGFIPPPNYKMHREIGVNSLAAGLIRTNSTGNNGSSARRPTSENRVPFNLSTPGNLPPPYIDPAQTLVGAIGGVIGVGAHDVDDNRLMSYSPRGPSAWHLQDVLAVNPSYPLAQWSTAHNDYPWLGGEYRGLVKPDVTGPTNTTVTAGGGRTCALGTGTGTSNATPRVAGTLMLWKEANMSLGPEDIAMIVHQSATRYSWPGKQNNRGAGRVNALAGLYLALCTHRVNGQPAWSIDHRVGSTATWTVDTVPDAITVIALGTERGTKGAFLGLEGQVAVVFAGTSGPQGEASFQARIDPALVGVSIFSQCFTNDVAGATGRLLSSNVIETRFLP